MKNTLKLLVFAGTILAMGCVVAPYHGHVTPAMRVHYVVRGNTRIYILPRHVRRGDIIVINGVRCQIRKIKRNRVRVIYPDGASVWINVEFK